MNNENRYIVLFLCCNACDRFNKHGIIFSVEDSNPVLDDYYLLKTT